MAFSVRVSLLSKVSTGYVNMPVVPNAREVLIGLYGQCLEQLKKFPVEAGYRVNVEKITKYRLKVVEKSNSVEEFEKEIACGQAEQLIIQAKDELELIPIMFGMEIS